MSKLSLDERRAIREIGRERARLRCELDLLSIDRRELLEKLKYDTEAQRYSKELIELELKIDQLHEQLSVHLSAATTAKRFNVAPNTISSLTTARYR